MAYVWQQGIDAGDAQPVTDCPAGEQFPVPDAPWPGLGLDDDSQCWGVLWSRLDDNIKGLVGKALRLERERVRYDVYGKVAKALNERIDELFDCRRRLEARRREGEAARLHRNRRPSADVLRRIGLQGRPQRAAGLLRLAAPMTGPSDAFELARFPTPVHRIG